MGLVACSSGVPRAPLTAHEKSIDAHDGEPLPYDIVERSRVGFVARSQTVESSGQAMTTWLAEHRVVCVGERHTEPAHHYVQKEIIRRLAEWARSHDAPFAVGFEMFERAQQSHLDAFAQGQDPTSFEAESGYQERWGFDFSLYRPLLEAGRAGGAQLLALNAPKAWTRQVAKNGFAQLDPALKSQLPELFLTDAEHRSFFAAAMSEHPGGAPKTTPKKHATPPQHQHLQHATPQHPQHATPQHLEHGTQHEPHPEHGAVPPATEPTAPAHHGAAHDHGAAHHAAHGSATASTFPPELESYYVAQVIWDETMAETASRWLLANPPNAHLVLVAGSGHCHESAIPRRIERRTQIPVLSTRAIAKSELDEPQVPALEQFDALFVMDE